MLRRRSKDSGVARFSQHMLGHAMDFFVPGVSLEKIRFAGLRLQRGGVGLDESLRIRCAARAGARSR